MIHTVFNARCELVITNQNIKYRIALTFVLVQGQVNRNFQLVLNERGPGRTSQAWYFHSLSFLTPVKHWSPNIYSRHFQILSLLLNISLLAVTCHLLIIFENSFDPDQALYNVSPDLDPNCSTHSGPEIKLLKTIIFKKISACKISQQAKSYIKK